MEIAKNKTFSILEYQNELIQKLNHKNDNLEEYLKNLYINLNNNVYFIKYDEIDFIEKLPIINYLPPFKKEILGLVNIKEKEYLLIDLKSSLLKIESKNISDDNYKKSKVILLKNKKIGFLAEIMYDLSNINYENIQEIKVEEILRSLNLA